MYTYMALKKHHMTLLVIQQLIRIKAKQQPLDKLWKEVQGFH